ncbi:hypothetical protein FRC01_007922 [Tulasnella sp. 417]|nr:hypothetical protein FRC01_007922 [Tulasnella sp. 417]
MSSESRQPHPTTSVNLSGWLAKHAALLEPINDPADAAFRSAHFALTSRGVDETDLYDINLHDNSLTLMSPAEQQAVSVIRDYDSVIGVFPTILPIKASLNMYTIPRPRGILDKNLSVFVDIPNSNYTEVALHLLPNYELGTIGQFAVNVAFPALYNPTTSQSLTDEHYRLFFNHAVRPAIVEHSYANITHWPADYNCETIRARAKNGGITHTTHTIHKSIITQVLATIRENCDLHDDLAWARDFMWIVDAKGLKEEYRHRPRNHGGQCGRRQYSNLLNIFEVDLIDPGRGDQLYIDVALEFSQEGRILLWKTHSHEAILREVLGINDIAYYRSTQRFTADTVALMQHAAGFRVHCGPSPPIDHVRKLNVYTTDKAPTALIDQGHHAKFITAKEALVTTRIDGLTRAAAFAGRIRRVYEAVRDQNVPGNARLEGRVDFTHATSFMVGLDFQHLIGALVSVPVHDWWTFKCIRLAAASFVLEQHLSSTPTRRTQKQALGLVSVCVWIINALNARPCDRAAERELQLSCLPQIRSPEGEWESTTQGGMFLIHRLVQSGGLLQLPLHNLPDGEVIARALGFQTWSEVLIFVTMPTQRASKQQPQAEFRRNNRTAVRAPSPELEESQQQLPSDEDRNSSPSLTSPNSTPSTPATIPFDLDLHAGSFDYPRRDQGVRFSHNLYSLFVRTLREMLSRAPNERDGGAYLVAAVEPSLVDLDFFKVNVTEELPRVFRKLRLVTPVKPTWDASFDRLFPKKGAAALSGGGWQDLGSRQEWVTMTALMEDDQINEIRKQFKKEFDTFTWFPVNANDKIWKVLAKGNNYRGNAKAPWIMPRLLADWEAMPRLD